MKKLLFSLIAVVCFSFTALANKDASGVIVRGEGPLAQYKKALSLDAVYDLNRKIYSGVDGAIMLDLTPDVYDFYNISLSENGPTDGKILMYVNNLDKSTYDFHAVFVYDIIQMDGVTYVTVRALAPNGFEIASTATSGKAENFEQLMNLFHTVRSSLIDKVNNQK